MSALFLIISIAAGATLAFYILWQITFRLLVWLFPDKRPTAEIIAEVKECLRQMPAAKEIHAAYAELDKAFPDNETEADSERP